MPLLIAVVLATVSVFATTALHYETIHRLDLYARTRPAYPTLYGVITALILLHMAEIGLYAVLFALADGPLALGDFKGAGVMGPMDDIYFAAEAYASLGYGDVTPTGEMPPDRLGGAAQRHPAARLVGLVPVRPGPALARKGRR